MFSTAPTFPFVAAIKSGYKVLRTKEQVRNVYLALLITQASITLLNILTFRTDSMFRTWLCCFLSS